MNIFGTRGHFWKVRVDEGLKLEFSLTLRARQYSLFVSVLTSIAVLLLVRVCMREVLM